MAKHKLEKGKNTMSEKVFIEKTEEVGPYRVVLDWSMGKYGVSVQSIESYSRSHGIDAQIWQTEFYEFKEEVDAQSAFDLAVELCRLLLNEEVKPKLTEIKPKLTDLVGIDPDFTGGLSLPEYFKEMEER